MKYHSAIKRNGLLHVRAGMDFKTYQVEVAKCKILMLYNSIYMKCVRQVIDIERIKVCPGLRLEVGITQKA